MDCNFPPYSTHEYEKWQEKFKPSAASGGSSRTGALAPAAWRVSKSFKSQRVFCSHTCEHLFLGLQRQVYMCLDSLAFVRLRSLVRGQRDAYFASLLILLWLCFILLTYFLLLPLLRDETATNFFPLAAPMAIGRGRGRGRGHHGKGRSRNRPPSCIDQNVRQA